MAGLLAVMTAAWIYTIAASVGGDIPLSWSRPQLAHSGHSFGSLVVMWTIMMTAMMLPTAWPMILLFAGVQRNRTGASHPVAATALFVGGYLAAWSLYSVAAAGGQFLLRENAFLSPQMASTSPLLAGLLLIGAGVFQWTPFKESCLRHCRSPVGFLATYWQEGLRGAVGMGLRHGTFCVGCCWVLMLVLFVTGVMNILWMVVLTLLTLAEKVVPPGLAPWIRHGSASGLLIWGLLVLTGSL